MPRSVLRRCASSVVAAAVLAGGLVAGAGSASAAGAAEGSGSSDIVGGSLAVADSVTFVWWTVGDALEAVLGVDYCLSTPVSLPPDCQPLS